MCPIDLLVFFVVEEIYRDSALLEFKVISNKVQEEKSQTANFASC